MIEKISRIQKIVKNANSPLVAINSSLPLSILVSQKIGFNRYILNFANRNLNTKSAKELNVGSKYWGEVQSQGENIVIKNLYEKPRILDEDILADGLNLIENLIENENLSWFYDYLFKSLSEAKTKDEMKVLAKMLFALQENVVHIPFIYNGTNGVFQLKKEENDMKIFLIFSNFAPLIFKFKNEALYEITTPFNNVASLLKREFSANIIVQNVSALWSKKEQIIDIKG
jgi:putative flavoprotein